MHSPSPSSKTTLDVYLSDLDDALVGLGADERREILMETQSHVTERTARFPFPSVEDVLEQLGTPKTYARQFLRDDGPTRTTERRSALQGLARLAAGGWFAVPVLLAVVFAYTIALAAFAIGLAKVVSPGDVGVWVRDVGGERHLLHAGFNAGLGGQEILGYWLALIAFAVSFVIWLALSVFLRWLARANGIFHTKSKHESPA